MNTVTITLNASIHYTNGRINFKEGEKIKLAKHLWERTQTTKNRMVVFRMLKKEYYPYTTIDKVTQGGNETKDLKELKNHFTNLFNKNKKNGITEKSKNGTDYKSAGANNYTERIGRKLAEIKQN